MKTIAHKFQTFLSNPKTILVKLLYLTSPFLPDSIYLRLLYRYHMGHRLNLRAPKTYNEKLNWLKIHDHNPQYPKLVDKEAVKAFVSERVGAEYVIPTIGVWEKPDDIDFMSLPNQFVLKTTHGGGNTGVIICRDKQSINKGIVLSKLRRSMRQDLYKDSREWPYKNVEKRIICEPYIEDEKTGELRDYKFFCFNGEVKALFVATDRQKCEEPFFNFFDKDYTPLPIKQGHPVAEIIPPKPDTFEEMKSIASKLSEGFSHVRVDLYEANGKVLFGELTFYHFGGVVPFEPFEWDNKFGEWINLPQIAE